jgi:hypothetical protein
MPVGVGGWRAASAAATCALSVVVATTVSHRAHAANYQVSGDVTAQGYEVASPWGDRVLGKRRLNAGLGLGVYNLQGDYVPGEADYSVVMRVRFDYDFGIDPEERSFDEGDPTRFVPGQREVPLDLMYGWIEGKNLADGWFGFRLGRQYVTDTLGWWSFDGALARMTTPFFVQAEVYGGLEQRGGFPLSTGRYESQGVWRGSHDGLRDNAHDYPSYQFAGHAPAFGGALETAGPTWIHGRLTYRRVYNTEAAFTGQFPYPDGGGFEKVEGLRVSSEQVGYGASAFLAEIGTLRGGFSYDLYNQLINRASGGVEFYPIANKLTVGADVDFFVPTYDADSIWNWFTHNPVITALGRVATRPVPEVDISLSGGARLWMADGDPNSWASGACQAINADPAAVADCRAYGTDPSYGLDGNPPTGTPNAVRESLLGFSRQEANRETTIQPDLLANLGVGYRWGSGRLGVDGMMQMGFGDEVSNRGRRVGGGLSARQALVSRRLFLGGRASLYNWHDPLRDDRDATSFGYMVAPEYRPIQQTRLRVEWEHNMNRLVGQRFRIVGLIGVEVGP